MHQVVSSAICAPLSSLPNGYKNRAMPSSEMDGDLVQRYISGLTRYRSGNLPKAAQGLSHLVRFLHQQGVTQPTARRASIAPIEQWLVDYDAHLEQVAGLALSTRQGYRRLVRRFITACFGAETPDWSVCSPPP